MSSIAAKYTVQERAIASKIYDCRTEIRTNIRRFDNAKTDIQRIRIAKLIKKYKTIMDENVLQLKGKYMQKEEIIIPEYILCIIYNQ